MNLKKIIRISGNVLSTVFLILALALCALVIFTNWSASKSGEEPFYLGYRPCQTLTGSMEPYMMTNSIFIMKEVNSIDEVAVGDVVTYTALNDHNDTIYITHRITNITEDGIITTKGDNNRVDDGFALTMDNVIAKEVAVFNQPFVWFFNTWESGTTGKVMIIASCLAVILLLTSIGSLISHWLNDDEIEETAVKEYTKLCRKLGLSPAETFETDLDRMYALWEQNRGKSDIFPETPESVSKSETDTQEDDTSSDEVPSASIDNPVQQEKNPDSEAEYS